MNAIRLESRTLILAALVAGFPACSNETDADSVVKVEKDSPGAELALGESHELGEALVVQNLTVWPVYATDQASTGEILTLDEAEERALVEIREKGVPSTDSEEQWTGVDLQGADVNQLIVENRSDRPILICAGTILKGGQQDRQVGDDFLIAARETMPIDAFCVEQGRWTGTRDGATTNGVFQSSKVVATKRVRASAQYLNDQSSVWSNVGRVNAYAHNSPRTGTLLSTIEDLAMEAVERRTILEEAVKTHFDQLLVDEDSLVGFAYAINGEPLTMRVFANKDLFGRQFAMFRKAMCIEADVIQRRDQARGREVHTAAASVAVLRDMIQAINNGHRKPETVKGQFSIAKRDSDRGGRSTLSARQADGSWRVLTDDWTAPVEYTNEVRIHLEGLNALGYTGDSR